MHIPTFYFTQNLNTFTSEVDDPKHNSSSGILHCIAFNYTKDLNKFVNKLS